MGLKHLTDNDKSVANGVASLDGAGKVPSSQLPAATESVEGIAEIATQAEADVATDDTKIITPLKAKNITGIQGFFLQARGLFGTGQGWADNGFIGDVPMILYANSITEKAVYSFFALSRAKFDTVNPIVSFAIYSVGAPIITTGDQVRWQLEVRYIAEGDLATKAPDETILLTQTLTVLLSDARQEQIDFTLDRTLISDQDSIQLTLSRLGGDVADTYSGDIGGGQSGITIQTTNHNP